MTIELPFTQSFASEIAMDFDPPEDVCDRHGVSYETFEELQLYKPFQEQVAEYKKVWQESGITPAMKAKIAVEDLIPTLNKMVKDKEIPAAVRKGAFDSLVNVSKLGGAGSDPGAGGGFQVNINFPTPKQAAVDVTPTVQGGSDLTLPRVD